MTPAGRRLRPFRERHRRAHLVRDRLGDFLQRCDLVKFAKYEPREPELPPGGVQQIDAADHVGHTLEVIVHRHRKLIRPVAMSIAQQHIAALFRWALLLRAETEIVESFD